MIDKGQWWEFGQDTGVTPLLDAHRAALSRDIPAEDYEEIIWLPLPSAFQRTK